jgi:predicted kinase
MRLVLVRGLPGSGKSTFVRDAFEDVNSMLQLSRNCCVHYEADAYFMDHESKYRFDADKLHRAHAWCYDSARVSMNRGWETIVSNTFTTLKEMKQYLDHAELVKMPVLVFRMTQSYGSLHNVPEATIQKMIDRFEDYPGEILVP